MKSEYNICCSSLIRSHTVKIRTVRSSSALLAKKSLLASFPSPFCGVFPSSPSPPKLEKYDECRTDVCRCTMGATKADAVKDRQRRVTKSSAVFRLCIIMVDVNVRVKEEE